MFGAGLSTLLVEMYVLINSTLTLPITLLLLVWFRRLGWPDKIGIAAVALVFGGPLAGYQVTVIAPALYAHNPNHFLYGSAFSALILWEATYLIWRCRRR